MDELERLRQFQPQVLLIVGGALQYLMRAQTGVKEVWYYVVTVLLSVGVYGLFNVVGDEPWRFEVVNALIGISAAASSLYGGTFIASNIAKGAVAAGADPAHPLVPLTNSK